MTEPSPELDEGIPVPPPAAAMMEALRGLGYSLPEAVADIIDNSISAAARNIWITFHWAGRHSFIAIVDDGAGMSERDLLVALTVGSRDPRAVRADSDLGRFGLGLKTASFSQARSLTVASRCAGAENAIFRWDLDFIGRVNDWRLLRGPREESDDRIRAIEQLASGTVVLLENLDRVVGLSSPSDRPSQDEFLANIDRVEQHLAMVFHRYVDGAPPALRIFINGQDERHRVRPWDPFLTRHPATIATPIERIGLVEIQGFVLPHRDRLSDKEFESAAGPEGWTAQQGFYVYRGRRLMEPGSWLGLGETRAWTKEEPYKLARLRIDLPNTADAEWKIDVRKSTAAPPDFLKARLRDLALYVRAQARKVLAFRGSPNQAQGGDVTRAWAVIDTGRDGQIRYRINREHPAVRQVLEYGGDVATAVEGMLRVIETTVPIQRLWLDTVDPREVEASMDGHDSAAVEPVMRLVFGQLVHGDGLSPDEARHRLLRTEPFQRFPELIANIAATIHQSGAS
ncbi:MAG: ATP-binding protein [Rhodoplanes sp.]